MKRALALGVAGGASLLALAMAVPGEGVAQRSAATRTAAAPTTDRIVGSFTPAVRDPRLAAELARRRAANSFQFTPATTPSEGNRAVRVAVRVRPGVSAPEVARPLMPGATAAIESPSGTAITPSTYNLGVAVGWRRFAITGDTSTLTGGIGGGSVERARVGVDYRPGSRVTARVQVEAEQAEGVQRIVGNDRAVALDVGGSYSIARGIDVTGGVRYRVSRDRIEPLARDERQDSQAVYVGTAIRF